MATNAKTNPPGKPGTAVTKPASTGVANWKERLANMAKESVEQEASVSTGNFVGTRGGQLSWQGSPIAGNKLNCIVVDAILENAYYPGKFDPDNPEPPVCYAFGRDEEDMKPHPEATDPQADTCAECQWNDFKTADTGKGKACKNIRRLGLIAPPNPMTEEGVRKAEVGFFKTPVTSVKAWAAYVRSLEALRHLPTAGVITEISTIPDPKTQFKVLFNHVEDLPDELIPAALDRHDEVKLAIDFPYPKAEEKPAAPPPRGKAAPAGKRKY